MHQALMLPNKVVLQFPTKRLYEKCHAIAYYNFDKRFSPIPGKYNPKQYPMDFKRFKTEKEFRTYLSNLNNHFSGMAKTD